MQPRPATPNWVAQMLLSVPGLVTIAAVMVTAVKIRLFSGNADGFLPRTSGTFWSHLLCSASMTPSDCTGGVAVSGPVP